MSVMLRVQFECAGCNRLAVPRSRRLDVRGNCCNEEKTFALFAFLPRGWTYAREPQRVFCDRCAGRTDERP